MKSINLIILWALGTLILLLSTSIRDSMLTSSTSLNVYLLIYVMDLLHLAITFLVFKYIFLNYTNPDLRIIKAKRNLDINI